MKLIRFAVLSVAVVSLLSASLTGVGKNGTMEVVKALASAHVESVSGETLSTTGGKLKIFDGTKTMGSVTIEPFSVTTLIIP